ncbi:MAG: L-glutamate gamma-semialdehyde dehydrogenase [Thermoanaerobaculum sp.]|nr:L-glutamate gamma-semialdehyde dehydrogenase [Thermoanaerobaculum sp.]MCX7895273.1 L-glutamate gamma-semialdehyde dehydrogenase [Thermoanaerobaculum sp.]MDW7968178.1 L-glutamate gamma-semialdehyde dehydrogenase [Thermoanaerobaculum sp.]
MSGSFRIPKPVNEPVKQYAPGSPERLSLKKKLAEMRSQEIEIPLVIGGKEVRTGKFGTCVMPHRHGHVLARYHKAGPAEVDLAIQAALEAHRSWSRMAWYDRAAIFLKAAELLAGPWRDTMNAATMLGQSKTVFQAEIDSACEIIDFWRYNPYFMQQIYDDQPYSPLGQWNRVEYRPLEGFVFAVTPFNFTSIGANLPTSPALMGNTVVWKPASTAVYSAYFTLRLLEEAGLPPGVINLVVGSGGEVGNPVLASEHLAGLHFTGSTSTFQAMWRTIAENLPRYRSYPRVVGETGGKDFVFAHASADVPALVTALVRGAFEYQGQKCSAASRAYIPQSLWPQVKEQLLAQVAEIKVGDVEDFRNFMGAVIDRAAFDSIVSYIEYAKQSPDAEILVGGTYDASEGYFIQPTVVLAKDHSLKLMQEEIFGPVLTIFVYRDEALEEALHLCDTGSPYALTGSVFAQDRQAIAHITERLRDAAGNFYINDKPTGAVVGQQPFGGARASGTNDKAGSMWNLIRWVSPRAIKETFVPPRHFAYPFMGEA